MLASLFIKMLKSLSIAIVLFLISINRAYFLALLIYQMVSPTSRPSSVSTSSRLPTSCGYSSILSTVLTAFKSSSILTQATLVMGVCSYLMMLPGIIITLCDTINNILLTCLTRIKDITIPFMSGYLSLSHSVTPFTPTLFIMLPLSLQSLFLLTRKPLPIFTSLISFISHYD